CFDKLYSFENLEFYSNNFDVPKVNKTDIMKNAINKNNASGLEFAVRDGWLKAPKKRDEMIAYAAEKKSAECSAYLLDFKNRTADLAAEQVKAEKKLERELNAAPDSVAMLKQIWSYKKREDGTIIITNYKGTQTKITVPAKIGKSAVTAIGKEAFSPFHDRVCGNRGFFKTITEITLPDGIVEIGERAFDECHALRAVNIPEGVAEIKSHTFADCFALENIVIPSSVKIIGDFAFFGCESLKTLVIPEGVERIGKLATCQCRALETVELPRSLKAVTEGTSASDSLFYFSPHLKSVIVPRGSYAEEYCKKYNIRYTVKEDT
ncbi:MAG: leucine-rich repeat domain-containing protein, partial [Oscillospiraceae bacterium]|nr:leucine-rich repeat domain-containing protein [Oscillospiraceae bacterium]